MNRASRQVAVSAMDCIPSSPVHARFWRALFANMGVRLESPSTGKPAAEANKKEHDLLLNGPLEKKP